MRLPRERSDDPALARLLIRVQIEDMAESPEFLLDQLGRIPPYTYPDQLVAEMTYRLDEMVPALLGVLKEWQSAPEALSADDRSWLRLTFSAFLLARAGETRAFRPLLSLVSLPGDLPEEIWGDALTESLGRVLASVFDGDESPLRAVLEDSTIDEFVRGGTIVDCYATLITNDLLPRERVESYFAELFDFRLEREPAFIWNALSSAAADLGFTSLRERVRSAYEAGWCDPMFEPLEDIERRLEAGGAGDDEHFISRTSLVSDVVAETGWWACFDPAAAESDDDGEWDEEFHEDPLDELLYPTRTPPTPPFVREAPKIGRNDPCPCGSGKKFKKCCG